MSTAFILPGPRCSGLFLYESQLAVVIRLILGCCCNKAHADYLATLDAIAKRLRDEKAAKDAAEHLTE